jgi:glycogen debranching enzyme
VSNVQAQGEGRGLLPRFTLKHGNTFLLADALGDIQGSDDGLYSNDTRMLSRLELSIASRRPSLLGAAISQDNTLFTTHLTNLPLPALGEQAIPQGVIHIERSRFLWDGRIYERMRITNFSDQDARVPLKLQFAADFLDIFEVQGHVRAARGAILAPQLEDGTVRLAYQGRDDRLRTTDIRFSNQPVTLSGEAVEFRLDLPKRRTSELFLEIGATPGAPGRERFENALQALSSGMRQRLHAGATLESSGRLFNDWLDRSRADLALLSTDLPTGIYPYAGIPWFATQFGRDAIITALQTLWLDPQIAAGVLRFLASTQARETDAFRDAEPGKILHEMRRGEMAALHEVPFGRYYGAVDTTPLFVMLGGAYERQTGDTKLIDQLWPNLLAATAWIERRLSESKTGFLDYSRGARSGLVNQGWKDSHDSMFHADGRIPEGPLAVIEVQGYACAAFIAMAELAEARDDRARSVNWRSRAEQLRSAIEERFWDSAMGFYAIAIDGAGAPCKVRGSNPGHLLYCSIPSAQRGAQVAEQLMSQRFHSGWGIRTLAEGEPRFNPMSYHDGSVWPHDTALCGAGIARYLGRSHVVELLSEMFEAASLFAMRLPELYCGFTRVAGQGPAPYPVACLPQAWAAGSVFMLLQACLGISVDGRRREVHIEQPMLPVGVEALSLRGLRVGEAQVDIDFQHVGNVVVAVPRGHREGGVAVYAHL